jgi:tetratricopeptide (TPR) repeat protein
MYHPGSTHPKDVEYAKKSVEEFEKLLKLQAPNPDTAEKVRNYYVALLRSAEMTDKVIAYYKDLLTKEPKNGQLYAQLAEIYAKQGDVENALKYYEKRTEIEPNSKEAWYTIGVVCWDRSYHGGPIVSDAERQALIDRGMKALDKALSMDPEYYDALAYEKLLYLEQSKVLTAQQKQVEAGEAYAKAGEIDAKLGELRKKKQAAPAPSSGG